MSDLCEHQTFKDICGICHRDGVIARLTAENERLRAEVERLGRDYQSARDAHDRRLQDIGRLTAALEFYAEKEKYSEQLVTASCGCCTDYVDAEIFTDEGSIARAAIAAALAAWPGADVADDDDWCAIYKGTITLPQEPRT